MDLNAEMIEKSISSKSIRAYKNTLYIIYHRNFEYITYMINIKKYTHGLQHISNARNIKNCDSYVGTHMYTFMIHGEEHTCPAHS